MKNKDDSEDKKLWAQVAASVKPLAGRKKKIAVAAAKPAPRVPIKALPPAKPVRTTTAAQVKPVTPPRAPNPGFDTSTATKLKKGELPIEGRIDLHGMTQEKAFEALHGFINRAARAGKRTLLVITGKGSVKTGGVLRRNLPLWLEGRADILAITPAAPKDGGSGAFYIRLRKPR